MSSISTMEARMPPGFRFHPRDDELVLDYLLGKLTGGHDHGGVAMVDVDLKKCEPWDLPEAACVGGKEWYFFSLRDRKYSTGQRTNRATRSGYWKATGRDRDVVAGKEAAAVGMRKTLVFYRGRAPRGRKTEWVMHEFRLSEPPAARPWPEREPPAIIAARHQRFQPVKYRRTGCYAGCSIRAEPPPQDHHPKMTCCPLSWTCWLPCPCHCHLRPSSTPIPPSPAHQLLPSKCRASPACRCCH